MKITVSKRDQDETELVVYCSNPEAPEVQELLRAVSNTGKKIPASLADNLSLLEPSKIFYGEFVGRGVFLYTEDEVYSTALTLAQLENDYNGFLRCSKSMVVNLHQVERLKSELNGRIIATLANGERILISRHYASALRKALTSAN